MKEGNVTLSTREQKRLMVLNQVGSGSLSSRDGAALLGLSERQLRRLRRNYEAEGAKALAHGNRGRPPANAVPPAVRNRVVALATTRYQGFNQQHLTEMLAERERIQLSRPTVHRILRAAGVPSPRRRRPPRARRRRDRFPREGMLLQMDASRHDWLEGRGPWLSLVGAIDDATGVVPWASFREQEDAQAYFELMQRTARRKGLPMAVYSDRHGIFFHTENRELTLEEQLDGRQKPTQFGRLLEELGVQLILARSPQAKGRVERLWGTFQDRLGSELRLADAGTIDQANAVLAKFLPRHNRRFAVPAYDPTPAWLPAPDRRRQDELFCFKHRRVVRNDHTVQFGHHVIDIPPGGPRRSYARAEVELYERFDGTLAVYFQGTCLTKIVLPTPPTRYRLDSPRPVSRVLPQLTSTAPRARTVTGSATPSPPPAPTPVAAPRAPAATHPWRIAFSRRQRNRTKSPKRTKSPDS